MDDYDYIFDELMDEGLTTEEASNFICCMVSNNHNDNCIKE